MNKTDAWMPLWIGSYLADTMHLTRDEHGGYLLLIMAYWRSGSPLPDDDKKLAAIVKASPKEWRELRDVLSEFFTIVDGVWRHKRIDRELESAGNFKAKQQANGAKGGRPRKTQIEPKENPNETQIEPKSEPKRNPSETSTPTPTPTPYSFTQSSVLLDAEGEAPKPANATPPPSRAGQLCQRLRALGIVAAPHQPQLVDLLAAYSDEAIIAVAEIVVKAKPGERISVGYLAPKLADMARVKPPARTPPPDNFSQKIYPSEIAAL